MPALAVFGSAMLALLVVLAVGIREAASGIGAKNGAPCTSASDCQTGICADGVCCDALCNAGACTVCSKAAGAVANGTCTPLSGPACDDGQPCTRAASCQSGVCVATQLVACPSATCQAGICNPLDGGCTTTPEATGTACDDGSGCTVGATCQPDGSCAGAPLGCPPADACHDAGTCVPGAGCDLTPALWCGQGPPVGSSGSTAAAAALADGSLCSVDAQCRNGHCVGGVCCDQACTEPCHACAVPASLGKCVPEPRGVDLGHDCAPEGTCRSTCDGDGGCLQTDTDSTCSPAKCVDLHTWVGDVTCHAGVCDLASRATLDCAPYLCVAALGQCAQHQRCDTVRDCVPGYVCDEGHHCNAPPDVAGGDDGGCGCRAARGSPAATWPAWILCAGLALRRRAKGRR